MITRRDKRRYRDDAIALGVVALIGVLSWLGSRYSTFRWFFAWPMGGTWANTLAWLEDDAIALFVAWYFRDHVGRRLTGWWHQHRQGQMDSHMSAVRSHVNDELTAFEGRVCELLRSHREEILGAVNGNVTSSAGNEHDTMDTDGNAD
jgi:hypothetical protein